jgi:protein-arginine kinase activator protein McsA
VARRRVCEECGRDLAVWEVAGVALCASCARRKEADFVGGDLLLIDTLGAGPEPSEFCSFCGATMSEIEQDGLAGCWKCYDTFGDRLTTDAVGE